MVHNAFAEQALGERVTPTSDGLYRVKVPDGPSLVSHGPDTRAEILESRLHARTSPTAARAPACATDHYQYVLYANITGAPDHYAASRKPIRTTFNQADAILDHDATASGGRTADYKVACTSSGQIRIGRFTASGEQFDDVVASARAAGFQSPDADYTIFLDGGQSLGCGVASYRADERLTADNRSNSGGGYAVVYRGCWVPETLMHENGHNEGAVQYGAPHSTGTGGHCWDEIDVMCYSPDGGDLHQSGTETRCSDRVHFDCAGDDYFNTNPAPGSYLATHWNLGSPLNRFMEVGRERSRTRP